MILLYIDEISLGIKENIIIIAIIGIIILVPPLLLHINFISAGDLS